MNRASKLESCFEHGGLDLKKLMEFSSIRFDNLSLDDVRFIESECRELRRKFEDAEKVDCFKTRGIQDVGWDHTAYFSMDEAETVKKLSKDLIDSATVRSGKSYEN